MVESIVHSLFGGWIVLSVIYMVVHAIWFHRHATWTIGEVVAVRAFTVDPDSTDCVYAPVVTFTIADGRRVTAVSSTRSASAAAFSVGARVRVGYVLSRLEEPRVLPLATENAAT